MSIWIYGSKDISSLLANLAVEVELLLRHQGHAVGLLAGLAGRRGGGGRGRVRGEGGAGLQDVRHVVPRPRQVPPRPRPGVPLPRQGGLPASSTS